MSHHKLNEDQRLELLAAYRAGDLISVIAKRFGVSMPYVTMLAARRGEPLRGQRVWKSRGFTHSTPSAPRKIGVAS